MSYKLTAMKFPTALAMISISLLPCGQIQKGTTSTSPKILKRRDFPSITGCPDRGPIFPRPRIAVPSVTMTATLLVLLYTPSSLVRALKLLSVNSPLSSYTFWCVVLINIFPTSLTIYPGIVSGIFEH